GSLRPASSCARGNGRGLSRQAHHRLKAPIHVSLSRSPGRYADAHRGSPLPQGSTAPASAVFLNAADYFPCHLGSAEGNQHLIDDHVVQHLEACALQSLGESLRVSTGSLHYVL